MAGVIYFTHLHPDRVRLYTTALEGLDVELIAIHRWGRSSAYTQLAKQLRTKHGSVMAGLLAEHPPKAPETKFMGACSYSAGYGLTRELLRDGRPWGVDLVVSIDSIYAGEDADGTASDKDLAGFAEFARDARQGDGVFWLGHGDVPVHGYASTTQVAEELRRLAGEPEGGFHIQSFDVAHNEGAEHALALTQWGPEFLAQAVRALQDQLTPPSSYVY